MHHAAVLSRSVVSDSLQPQGMQSSRLLWPWGFSRREYSVGCHVLLQGIFPTQGSNPVLPHYRWILYHLSHQGSPRILEWVAYPFSKGTSPPRNQTSVSWIAGRFFTSRATWETLYSEKEHGKPGEVYGALWTSLSLWILPRNLTGKIQFFLQNTFI